MRFLLRFLASIRRIVHPSNYNKCRFRSIWRAHTGKSKLSSPSCQGCQASSEQCILSSEKQADFQPTRRIRQVTSLLVLETLVASPRHFVSQ
uniref:Uncharacterized protein n=1 Tax=Physcomitrium patens TaxID=3218 RepID=A0A2K1JIX1_PHYPA|nr:hypothetical protein PHYPA_018679 [Physcomitrium patens]